MDLTRLRGGRRGAGSMGAEKSAHAGEQTTSPAQVGRARRVASAGRRRSSLSPSGRPVAGSSAPLSGAAHYCIGGGLAPASKRRPTTMALLSALLVGLMLLGAKWSLQAQAVKLQPEGREKFYWSGEQFVITCQNNNNIKNVKIRWIGPNGLDITEDRSQRVHAESSGPHGHRLVVMNATSPTDDGQYKCTLGSADDRSPREHIEFQLRLYKTTSFKDTPRHLVLAAGQQGTLSCHVEFDPAVLSASVGWVRDQRPIEMLNDSAYSVVEYEPSRQLSQLVISPLTKQHDGLYTCRAVALTAQLSKISDHNIQLETNYAPSFEESSHTVWVERAQSGPAGQRHAQHQPAASNLYPGARPTGYQHQMVRSRFNKPHYGVGPAAGRRPTDEPQSGEQPAGDLGQANSTSQLIKVELRCTCQANPPASILWTSTQISNFVLAKGQPAHVLEEPTTEVDGHNATSTLLISYSLDPEWAYRRDSYICSASNKLGKAAKTFTIEQGDPPPAFNVGPQRQYSAQTSLFKFTLLGPNLDPDSNQSSGADQQPADIVPPVDSFRIRAENPLGHEPKAVSPGSHWSQSRRPPSDSPSVQWSLANHNDGRHKLATPQNFTISLGRLPSGNQKLFLEAHNAVGWSPNATYLGDFHLVSGASSLLASGSRPLASVFNLLAYLLISSIALRFASATELI